MNKEKINSWEELHNIYKKEEPNWNEEYPFQTFENWLRYHCEAPKLKKEESEDKNIIIDMPLFEQGEIVINSLKSVLVMVTELVVIDNPKLFRGVVIWESKPCFGIGNSYMTWHKSSFKKTNFKIQI